MVKCHIRECESLEDPIESPELMSDLSDIRCKAIMKLKMVDDRKRSLAAGMLIRDVLAKHGKSQQDIVISDNGRPTVEGMDFNVSHSGSYVIIVTSDSCVGCDIEHIRNRNYSVAKRYFATEEIAWIDNANNKDEVFYRIWTARESYSKSTGEGILLDFKKYEIRPDATMDKPRGILDEEGAKYLGSCEVIREGKLQECIIYQWLYKCEYIISICVTK